MCMCVLYPDIELLFLVGGFAESAMLQADIKQQFGQRVKVAIPQDASLAILKGSAAVMSCVTIKRFCPAFLMMTVLSSASEAQSTA